MNIAVQTKSRLSIQHTGLCKMTVTTHPHQELIDCLQHDPVIISPKYLYDPLGCRLYDAIVMASDYYLPQAEAAIFNQYRNEIAALVGQNKVLVDLGSGDSRKAEGWFEALQPSRYVAVDIAESALTAALERLANHPHVGELSGVVTDFSSQLQLDDALDQTATLFFYPGSSIGNFEPAAAQRFLSQVAMACPTADSGVLIGFNCDQDAARLCRAYDDDLGITAAFNLNMLNHLNHVINSDFQPADWRHEAVFNADAHRIEMWLYARRDVTVQWAGGVRYFSAGEGITTEYSYKYDMATMQALLTQAGFGRVHGWQNPEQTFGVCYAERL